jgi:DNA-binding CsgD family transcriptional regulator
MRTWFRGRPPLPHVCAAPEQRCRNGVTVRERLPDTLRHAGVTVREDQVLLVVAERLGNAEIGRRLFISPRTAEKHVANLVAKTGQPDRARLVEYAASIVRGG